MAVPRPSAPPWILRPPLLLVAALAWVAMGGTGQAASLPAGFAESQVAGGLAAVYRTTTAQWFVFGSATGFRGAVPLGSPALGDVPVPADYDGDGKTDLAVYRRTTGEWFVFGSATGFGGATALGSPALGDTPVGATP